LCAKIARQGHQEVGTVKYIEALNPELQPDALGYSELLKERHVGKPLAWPYEGIASEVSSAAQAGGAKGGIDKARSKTVRPHIVRAATETRNCGTRTRVSGVAVCTAEEIVATGVDTGTIIDVGRGAGQRIARQRIKVY